MQINNTVKESQIETEIRDHLQQKYRNVFTQVEINSHVNNCIKPNQSKYLIEKIKPYLFPKAKTLDVGSGFGRFVVDANLVGYNCKGVEIEEFDFKLSCELVRLAGLSDNIISLGSAYNLPFESDSFDVVTLWNVAEHIEHLEQAITEVDRVLKPGGKIFIIAPNYAAFRREAHYCVPWFPLMPKFIGRAYLRLLKRDPWFLEKCIFYVTPYSIGKMLAAKGYQITTDLAEKIENDSFHSPSFKKISNVLNKVGLSKPIATLVRLWARYGLPSSIDFIATKK